MGVLEDKWEAEVAGKKIPWGWVALLSSVFVIGVLWSLIEVGGSNARSLGLAREAETILEKEKDEEMDAEKTISSIERVVESFCSSASVDAMLRYVRHPDRVRPLMENYYSERPLDPTRVIAVPNLDPLTIGNVGGFWMVSVNLAGAKANRTVVVEVESPEVAKVDWETYVCYQPMDWDEFVKTSPAGYKEDFRVVVEPDHYFTQEFSDSGVYDSFRLTTLNSEEPLYGYIEKDTELAQEMNKLFEENGMNPTPMILRLEVPDGLRAKRSVLIKKLVSPRWLVIDSPEVGQ